MWTVPPLLIVLVAAAYPLLRVCLESTKVGDTQRGWSTWSEVLASQMFRDALWRTVAIAVTSTAGCLVLGMFLAIVLAFVPFPGSRRGGAADRHRPGTAVVPHHAGVHVSVRHARAR